MFVAGLILRQLQGNNGPFKWFGYFSNAKVLNQIEIFIEFFSLMLAGISSQSSIVPKA